MPSKNANFDQVYIMEENEIFSKLLTLFTFICIFVIMTTFTKLSRQEHLCKLSSWFWFPKPSQATIINHFKIIQSI